MPDNIIQLTITPEALQAKKLALAGQGVIVPAGDAGVIERDGVKVSFVYNPNVLTVAVLHKPFFLPMDTVISHITAWFNTDAA
jgi:hypothetical protein